MFIETLDNQSTIVLRKKNDTSIVPSCKRFFAGFTTTNCIAILTFDNVYIDCQNSEILCCISLESIKNGLELLLEPIDVNANFSIQLKYYENKNNIKYNNIFDVTNNTIIAKITPLSNVVSLNNV